MWAFTETGNIRGVRVNTHSDSDISNLRCQCCISQLELLSRDWNCMLGFTEGDKIVHNSYLKLEKRKAQSGFWRQPTFKVVGRESVEEAAGARF